MSSPEPSPRPSSGDAAAHWLVLALATLALLIAFLLPPANDSGKGLRVGSFPLPPLCGFKMMTGVPCPGCGLTRSWVATAHGQFTKSFGYNRLGWLTMAYVLAQAFRHGLWLSHAAWRSTVDRLGKRLDLAIVVLFVLLTLNWLAMFSGILPKSLAWP